MSDIGITAMGAVLSYVARHVGWMAIAKYYFIPYMVRLCFSYLLKRKLSDRYFSTFS